MRIQQKCRLGEGRYGWRRQKTIALHLPIGLPELASADGFVRAGGFILEPSLAPSLREIQVPDVQRLYSERFQAHKQEARTEPLAINFTVNTVRRLDHSKFFESGRQLSVGDFTPPHLPDQNPFRICAQLFMYLGWSQGRFTQGRFYWHWLIADRLREAAWFSQNRSFPTVLPYFRSSLPISIHGNSELNRAE